MFVVFEREEDNHMAVLEREDGTTFNVQRHQIPEEARPGDSLDLLPNGTFILAPGETQKRKARLQRLMDQLWE